MPKALRPERILVSVSALSIQEVSRVTAVREASLSLSQVELVTEPSVARCSSTTLSVKRSWYLCHPLGHPRKPK